VAYFLGHPVHIFILVAAIPVLQKYYVCMAQHTYILLDIHGSTDL